MFENYTKPGQASYSLALSFPLAHLCRAITLRVCLLLGTPKMDFGVPFGFLLKPLPSPPPPKKKKGGEKARAAHLFLGPKKKPGEAMATCW